MRTIDTLVVHCSATKASMNIGAAEIRQWHLAKGWSDIGYSYVIRRDGRVETGRPEAQVGAHVFGHNSTSIGICLVGGLDAAGRAENNFTPEQFGSLVILLDVLRQRHPVTDVCGHRDFPGVKKDCPCFDVRAWVRDLGRRPDFSNVKGGGESTAPASAA